MILSRGRTPVNPPMNTRSEFLNHAFSTTLPHLPGVGRRVGATIAILYLVAGHEGHRYCLAELLQRRSEAVLEYKASNGLVQQPRVDKLGQH